MAREFAQNILADADYKAKLLDRAKRGVLHPAIEQMLWHYAYGKPKDVVELHDNRSTVNLLEMSDVELAELARKNAEEAARLATADREVTAAVERAKTTV